jgi:uncharacterized membrane protein
VRPVTRFDWLLFVHVAGAFLFLGGAVVAGVANVSALGRERPSEIAALLGLARIAVRIVGLGVLLTLVFGLWLVHEAHYGYGDAWVIGSLVLWVAANALGGIGGGRDRRTREQAERLAAAGDVPSRELRARLRDPVSIALSWGSGLAALAILALMVWKPGA